MGNSTSKSVSRRNVLKSAATASSGVAVFSTIGRATTVDKTRIPIIVSGDETVLSRKVPRNWWSYIKNVRRVKDRLRSQYASTPGVVDVSIVGSEKRIGGRTATQVNVKAEPGRPANVIPEAVDGVEVTTSTPDQHHLTSCTNMKTYSSVPGGVVVDDTSSTGGGLTSFCRAYATSTDSYVMMTAAHGWGSCENRLSLGDSLYQYGQYAGTATSYSMTNDIIMFEDDSGHVSYSNDVITSDGRWSIDGSATNYEYMDSENTLMHKTGRASGYTTGYIDEIDTSANVKNNDCLDLNENSDTDESDFEPPSVLALDTATGEERWRYREFPARDSIVTSVAFEDGSLYVASESGVICALNAESGEKRWQRHVSGMVLSDVTVVDGTVYFGEHSTGILRAVDAETGADRWIAELAGENVKSSPACADGTLYVGSHSTVACLPESDDCDGGDTGYLEAIDTVDGSVDWTLETSGDIRSSPAIVGNGIYVGNGDAVVNVTRDGTKQWQFKLGGAVKSSPAVAAGRLAIGCADGNVYVIQGSS